MKLMEKGNARAFNQLGGYYAEGSMGSHKIGQRQLNHLKAGELMCAEAYHNLGNSYYSGERGVEVDEEKARHYWELAAMNGNVLARNNLGVIEGQSGNIHRATKHFILAARAGHEEALGAVKEGYKHGFVTKDEYANTLRAHQKSKDEMKSEARDKAEDVLARNRAAS